MTTFGIHPIISPMYASVELELQRVVADITSLRMQEQFLAKRLEFLQSALSNTKKEWLEVP